MSIYSTENSKSAIRGLWNQQDRLKGKCKRKEGSHDNRQETLVRMAENPHTAAGNVNSPATTEPLKRLCNNKMGAAV